MRIFAAILACLLASVVACDDGSAPTQEPTAASTGTPGSNVTGTPGGTTALEYLDPIPFPENLALTLAMGCFQCDGPTTSIMRIRRTDSGIEERTVFSPPGGELAISGYAWDGGGNAAVAVCGPQYCGGLNFPPPGAQTIVSTARDGGVLFVAGDPIDGGRFLTGMTAEMPLLLGPFSENNPDPDLITYPDGTVVARPANALDAVALPTEILWINDGRSGLLDGEGSPLWSTPDGWQLYAVESLNAAGTHLVLHLSGQDIGTGRRLAFVAERDADSLNVTRQFDGLFLQAGAPLDECRTAGNAQIPNDMFLTPDTMGGFFAGFLPAIIDFCEGTVEPILEPFTREPYLNGRNYIVRAQQGPYLVVTERVGDCLNVRIKPATDSTVIDCFVAGVILGDLGESQTAGAQTWRKIVTPGGAEGWASEEFLAP